MRARTARLIAVSALVLGVFLAAVPAAHAVFHLIKIREIAGEQMTSNQSYIELQMYEAGQNQVAGHNITIWDADGFQLGCGPCPIQTLPLVGANPPNAQSQRTILIGDSAVAGRDFELDLTPYFDGDEMANLTPAGAACFEAIPVDCVSWGGTSFTGAANLPDQTTPYDGSLTQLLGVSGLRRSVGGGACSTALDATDDTNNANADFSAGIGAGGTPNSATPTETPCVPPQTQQPPQPQPLTQRKCKPGFKLKKIKKPGKPAKKKCVRVKKKQKN